MWNYPHLKLRGLPDHCGYANGLNLTGGYFYEKHAFFSSNDFLMSNLSNGDMLSSLKVYYGKVEDFDSIARGGLLLRRRRKVRGRLERKVLGRLGRLSLGGIYTNGPPQGDSDRYYSS